jgi:hypothetical protein
VVGGATVAGVMAAIPDSGGIIHSCYKNSNGSLRVIDSESGGVCTGSETALNWSQNGGSTSLNGQIVSNNLSFPFSTGASGQTILNLPGFGQLTAESGSCSNSNPSLVLDYTNNSSNTVGFGETGTSGGIDLYASPGFSSQGGNLTVPYSFTLAYTDAGGNGHVASVIVSGSFVGGTSNCGIQAQASIN